jgi:hypothetical protein
VAGVLGHRNRLPTGIHAARGALQGNLDEEGLVRDEPAQFHSPIDRRRQLLDAPFTGPVEQVRHDDPKGRRGVAHGAGF